MLLEFSCSNHKSIKNQIVFSMIASGDNTFIEKTNEIDGERVLRSAVIYGANGSGKSNFIDALSFVKNLVVNSIAHQQGQGIRQIPHKLEGFNTPSEYQIHFITHDIKYVFGFTLVNMLVDEEYLYYFPNGRKTQIFERKGMTISPGNQYKNKFSNCKEALRENRLFFSCAANFSNVQEIIDAFSFFKDEMVVYSSLNQDNWMNYSLYQLNTNIKMKNAVIAIMNGLGMGIKDIRVSIDKKKLNAVEIPPFFSMEIKNMLLQTKVDAISAKVVYDKFETDLLMDESNGVKKLFGLLCPLIDIIVNGKVLICDELESSLHESLVYHLLKTFMEIETEKFPQIIFTTHDTSLLSLDLFRRDQIWFVEMNNLDRSTDVYSLAELKNVRKEENYGRGYITGKYGAIPMLNLNFAEIMKKCN